MMQTLRCLALSAMVATIASAQQYTASPAGAGCGGAHLEVTFTPVGNAGNNTITITATGLHPHSVGGMIFGATSEAIGPVLGPDCFVRTLSIWSTQFGIDNDGVQVWQRSWPASVLGYYYIQLGSLNLDTLEVKFTNCVLAQHM
jgi:hypothetical protein